LFANNQTNNHTTIQQYETRLTSPSQINPVSHRVLGGACLSDIVAIPKNFFHGRTDIIVSVRPPLLQRFQPRFSSGQIGGGKWRGYSS